MTMLIETEYGPVMGRVELGGVAAFLGVPYAAPITVENRFDAPRSPVPWHEPRDATALGPVCPQVPTYGPVGTAATSALVQGEDFLTMNIRTPDVGGSAPVLVWIHGGGYAVGSANEPVTQSGAFAASGIVEVTVNYRLGAMGFLHLPDKPDNRGLLDIVAALGWVQRNIRAFGGDPARVTFGGRSAGGFATAAVMAMPAAHGLFAQTLPQSGASTGIATLADAVKLTARMCHALDTDIDGLLTIGLPDLLIAQRDLCNQSYSQHDYLRDGDAVMLGVPFVPVCGTDSLPLHPRTAAERGLTTPVPMVIGCTSAEYLTHSTQIPDGDFDFTDAAAWLHERVLPLGWTGAEIVARYRTALPHHSPRGIWREIAGDLVFQNPTTDFAIAHGAHHPVYKYLYGHIDGDETGCAHGAEVGAVWYRDGIDQNLLPQRQRTHDPQTARSIHQVWCDIIHGAGQRAPRADWPPYQLDAPDLLWISDSAGRQTDYARDPFFDRSALWQNPPAATKGTEA